VTDRPRVAAALLAAALAPLALARRIARPALRLGLRLAWLGGAALVTLWLVLPDPRKRLRTDQGGPLVLTDRHGTVLYQAPGASGRPGRESWVGLDQISPVAVMTLLASEEQAFFGHAGVDPLAVGRAALLNLQGRRVGYGASTLTMQLVRLSHWPEAPRTLPRKLAEVALALKLDRTMGKQEILEHYLNRAYYGHGAHGIEAAARRYLGRSAASLSTGEAAFLAVLPRGPRYYDPLAHPGRALARRDHVFDLLVRRGFLTRAEVDRARAQPLAVKLHAPPHRAPHLVAHVLEELPAGLRAQGGVVRTTLDLPLQERLQALTAAHVAGLARHGVTDAAVLVLDTQSGEVRALVGSQDFRAPGGQVNHLTSRRHLGSALKPFVYAAALARGDHPGSLADDRNVPGSGYYLVQPTQN
jgi:penicillin-binding protein 1C